MNEGTHTSLACLAMACSWGPWPIVHALVAIAACIHCLPALSVIVPMAAFDRL